MTPVPSPETLVNKAALVVVATAADYWRVPAANGTDGIVEFEITETLKGVRPSTMLRLAGTLTDKDDFNDRPAPYTFIRPDGRHGNCFATSYRKGGSFLLLLQPSTDGRNTPSEPFRPNLTPFWEALAPTNEQVHGPDDSWIAWVRRRLAP
jgi:hypothetical protein